MTKVTLTNTTKASQGVYDADGELIWVAPGSQKTLVPQDPERIERQGIFSVERASPDHDGDGVQSIDDLDQMRLPALKKLAATEGVDLQDATEKQDVIAAIRLDREAKAAAE